MSVIVTTDYFLLSLAPFLDISAKRLLLVVYIDCFCFKISDKL